MAEPSYLLDVLLHQPVPHWSPLRLLSAARVGGRPIYYGSLPDSIRAMKTTIDRLGRIVVPKSIRQKLRLQGGEVLEVEERDGLIELRPAVTAVTIVETPEGPVAQPTDDLAAMTDELVREVLEQVRR